MTTYTLRQGKNEILIRILENTAEKISRVDGNTSTSRTVMTPLEANREINSLLRQGFSRVTTSVPKEKAV